MNKHTSLILLTVIVLVLTACGNPVAVPQGLAVVARTGGGAAWTHTVTASDSLASVAAQYGVSIQSIIDANVGAYPSMAEPSATNRLKVGWVLAIPERGVPVMVDANAGTGGQGDATPVVMAVDANANTVMVVTPMQEATSGPALDENGGWWYDESAAQEIIQLTNAERTSAGLPEFSTDSELMEMAKIRAVQIKEVGHITHALLRSVCSSCGENLIWGGSPAQMVQGWMNSDGHQANILNGKASHIGVAYYRTTDNIYAVQLFR